MDWIGLDLTFPITDPTWIFLLVLLIILFAPILLNKLRIPHIIGMILAGLAIGEHGFNILARDSSFQLFGKVGLYYMPVRGKTTSYGYAVNEVLPEKAEIRQKWQNETGK